MRLRDRSGEEVGSATAARSPLWEAKAPGEACTIIHRFDQVPMSDGYLVEFAATAPGPARAEPVYDLVFFMSIYTQPGAFSTPAATNGSGACLPKAEAPVRPGATFRTRPEADPAGPPVMLSRVTNDRLCVVRVIALLPAVATEYAVAIGAFPLPGEGASTTPAAAAAG